MPAYLGRDLHKLPCEDIDSLDVTVHVNDLHVVCAISPIPTILAAHSLEVGGNDDSLIIDNAPEGYTVNGFPHDWVSRVEEGFSHSKSDLPTHREGFDECPLQESNLWPEHYECPALPIELKGLKEALESIFILFGSITPLSKENRF